ncbi:uncharacterized protein LOC108648175 [Xenopus tropicalis]|uniref:ribonuclease H n=1 Tax=Xenopus tropicalis TaxID=8364 RepID=A0A8J0T5S4_XENTR|nr:uncharacterized protein LOC108648175 [Xenopus tropicalis]|eukprot:XP_017951402.1 PREDICTED: uncharacterized protein LOC108648175 [Xenopus tropicalis]
MSLCTEQTESFCGLWWGSVIIAIVREEGIEAYHYLDDILLVADTETDAVKNLDRTIVRLQQFGWLINWEKSCLTPTQSLVFLGAYLKTLDNLVCLPLEKIQKMREQVRCLKNLSTVSVRMYMSVLGLMSSAIQMVKWARWHMRPLQNLLFRSGVLNPLRLNQRLHLPEEVKQSLDWWLVSENLSRGVASCRTGVVNHHHRFLRDRLGGSSGQPDRSGSVGLLCGFLQYPGTKGNRSGVVCLCPKHNPQLGKSQVGQRYSSGLYPETGREQKSKSDEGICL